MSLAQKILTRLCGERIDQEGVANVLRIMGYDPINELGKICSPLDTEVHGRSVAFPGKRGITYHLYVISTHPTTSLEETSESLEMGGEIPEPHPQERAKYYMREIPYQKPESPQTI